MPNAFALERLISLLSHGSNLDELSGINELYCVDDESERLLELHVVLRDAKRKFD